MPPIWSFISLWAWKGAGPCFCFPMEGTKAVVQWAKMRISLLHCKWWWEVNNCKLISPSSHYSMMELLPVQNYFIWRSYFRLIYDEREQQVQSRPNRSCNISAVDQETWVREPDFQGWLYHKNTKSMKRESRTNRKHYTHAYRLWVTGSKFNLSAISVELFSPDQTVLNT